MGNCIAGQEYIKDASAGRCGLLALRDKDGRVLANVDLRPTTHGWRVDEFRARFNDDPDEELAERLARWVRTIPPIRPPREAPPPHPARTRARRSAGGRPPHRLLHDVAEPLTRLAEEALADGATVRAAAVLTRLGRGTAGRDVAAVATSLRRTAPARLARACGDALRDGTRLVDLWAASGVRPLARALAGLEPAVADRYDQLHLLCDDAPLPSSLRRLARRPGVAAAYSMDLVGRRIRVTLGGLARAADPALAESLARHPDTGMLCALVLAVNSARATPDVTPVTAPGQTTVPGFPASSLVEDGPWQRAWPDARELGASPERCRERVAAHGLVVPAGWLGAGGWPALWHRAARTGAVTPRA